MTPLCVCGYRARKIYIYIPSPMPSLPVRGEIPKCMSKFRVTEASETVVNLFKRERRVEIAHLE